MLITPRRIIITVLAGAVGAALGASHLLCPTGECALTGSWYGTGAIGAILGFLYADGCPACAVGRCATPAEDDLSSLRPRDDDSV